MPLSDEEIELRLSNLNCRWESHAQLQIVGGGKTSIEGLVKLLDEMKVDVMACRILGEDGGPYLLYTFTRSQYGDQRLNVISTPDVAEEDCAGSSEANPILLDLEAVA